MSLSSRLPPGVALVTVLLVLLGLSGCSGEGAALPVATPSPSLTPTATASATPLPATATATSTTAPPTATPPPPTPIPSGGLQFKPEQLQQGGVAIVYLNEPASAATLTFLNKQYPMLPAGNRWWAIIGIGALQTPGLTPVTVAYTRPGQTASLSTTRSINIVKRDFPVEEITLDPQTATLLDPAIVNNEIAFRASIYSGYTAQRLWSGPFLRPSQAPLGDAYGELRSYNGAPATDYHRGTDFVADQGTPATAAAAGRVVYTGELKVRGNSVIIDHGAGVFTAYHHLSRIDVATGQMVSAGQQVGLVGSTGLVTGPHLHWEVLVRGVEVDGALWLQGSEIGP